MYLEKLQGCAASFISNWLGLIDESHLYCCCITTTHIASGLLHNQTLCRTATVLRPLHTADDLEDHS